MALTAVEHDREAVTEASAGSECIVVAMGAETLHEENGEGLGGTAVEQVADGVVDGNPVDAESGWQLMHGNGFCMWPMTRSAKPEIAVGPRIRRRRSMGALPSRAVGMKWAASTWAGTALPGMESNS